MLTLFLLFCGRVLEKDQLISVFVPVVSGLIEHLMGVPMPKKPISGLKKEPDLNERLTKATEIATSRLDLDQHEIFIRGIVHDINNNLMAILASCDHLEQSQTLMTDLPQHLKLIQKHVHYSSSLLRDLTNSQNMDRPLIMTMDELHHFLESILPSLSLIMGQDAMVELGPVVTSPVKVNRNPLLRVLLQLVRNVAEAEIEYPLAFVSVREVENWCEISVADNGPGLMGVSSEDIFKPGVTTRGPQGVRGYGLSTVARAVLDWGGEYGVENIDSGQGCRVWVRLPLARTMTV